MLPGFLPKVDDEEYRPQRAVMMQILGPSQYPEDNVIILFNDAPFCALL